MGGGREGGRKGERLVASGLQRRERGRGKRRRERADITHMLPPRYLIKPLSLSSFFRVQNSVLQDRT